MAIPSAAIFFYHYNQKVTLAIQEEVEKRKSLNKNQFLPFAFGPPSSSSHDTPRHGTNSYHQRSTSLTSNKSSSNSTLDSSAAIVTPYPTVTSQLEKVLVFLNRDFIEFWADPLSPDKRVSLVTREELKVIISALVQRVERLDLTKLLVTKGIPILTNHFANVRLAEGSVKTV